MRLEGAVFITWGAVRHPRLKKMKKILDISPHHAYKPPLADGAKPPTAR